MRHVVAALCAFVLLGAACAGGSGTSTTTPPAELPATTEQPLTTTTSSVTTAAQLATTTTETPSFVTGGSVVIAEDQEPPTLNPYAPGGDNFIVSIIGQAHLAGVYEIDATTLELIPELVTELPTVANGGVVINEDGTMTVRYEIRDEAVWSDGVPISGDDFAFTLGVVLDPESPVDPTTWIDIVEWDAGPKTFEYTLAQPTALFELLFYTIVPSHAVEGSDFLDDWNDTMWPSAGPFVVDTWQRGEFLRLVRNDRYWKVVEETGARLPYLDTVEFRFIHETDSLVAAFKAREVDVIQPPPSIDIIRQLGELESSGADVQVLAGPVWEHLNFQFGPNNRNPESLNEYAPFRQAVAYAIDSEVAGPLVGWIPIYSILNQQDPEGPWAQYVVDTERAELLLAEACELAERDCATDPPSVVFSTTVNADERPRIADHLVDSLGAVGIEVELQLEDSQLYFGETLDAGTWDVGWWAWVTSPGGSGAAGILDLFDPEAPPPDGANYYRWGTPDSSVQDEAVERFRDVIAILRDTVDSAEIISLAQAAEQILADNAVIIPVAARRVAGAVWADEIAGYQLNTTRAAHTWNIEFWHRVDL